MLNFCIKVSATLTQTKSSLSLVIEQPQSEAALEAVRRQWLPYLNQAAGDKLPQLSSNLAASIIRQSTLGNYHVLFFAIPIDYNFHVCMQVMVSCLERAMYSRTADLVIATISDELRAVGINNGRLCVDPGRLHDDVADLEREMHSAWEAHDIIEASSKRAAHSR